MSSYHAGYRSRNSCHAASSCGYVVVRRSNHHRPPFRSPEPVPRPAPPGHLRSTAPSQQHRQAVRYNKALATMKKKHQPAPAPAPLQCVVKNQDFCTNQDVRPVHPCIVGELPRRFHNYTALWCAGCRELLNGSFKYPKPQLRP